MAITDKQAKEVKEQLLKQVINFPEENREQIKKQINDMKNEEIEEFIKKNQLTHLEEEKSSCIFCSIVKEQSPSIKIAENSNSIAILDINPISKGHTLIIPKKHNKEPSKEAQELAFEIGGKIFEKFKPKDMTTRAAKVMDHTILNVIPLYEDTDIEKRTTTSQEELIKVAKEISNIPIKESKQEKIPEKKEPTIRPDTKESVCIFCSIANNESPSIIIDQNKDNTAILEINPISKGHTLVIPKKHKDTTEIPANTFTLAKKIAKKIKTKYKANDIKINPTSINNHSLIELIPIYDNTDPSKREKISETELLKIQKELQTKTSPPRPKNTTINKNTKKPITPKTKKFSRVLKPKRNHPSLPEVPPRIP